MTTSNFNLRGVSPEIMAHLKREAKELKISVNLLILKLIEQGLGYSIKPRRVVHRDLDFLIGTWSSKESKDFEESIKIFEMIDEDPVKLSGRLHEVFVEDFKRELSEIQSPAARHIFILAKATHLAHLRVAEYVALIAAADVTGHYGVGVLLESVLADKLAFLERTRRLIGHIIEGRVAERLVA